MRPSQLFSCLILRTSVCLSRNPFGPTHTLLLLDIPTFEGHVIRLATAGVYPLIAGSMGEAIHLSHSERVKLIHAARKALDNAGFDQVPIIAGTGAASTRETVELCNEAAAAGADYVIVLTNGFFAGVLASNPAALKAHFVEVAEKSPIPVFIYNCASSRIIVFYF